MTGYELVRSRRKTLSVQVTREGRVIVRAPLRLAKREIDRFVREHADWIVKALAHQRSLAEAHPELQTGPQAEQPGCDLVPALIGHVRAEEEAPGIFA